MAFAVADRVRETTTTTGTGKQENIIATCIHIISSILKRINVKLFNAKYYKPSDIPNNGLWL